MIRRIRRVVRAVGLAACALVISGCATFVAHEIEHPGHYKSAKLDAFTQSAGFQRHLWRTADDVPISYLSLAPRAYGAKIKVTSSRSAHSYGVQARIDFSGKLASAPLIPARGSIVLLHPWGGSGSAMGFWAVLFAQSGYQVLAPDFRDQGDSGDAKVGYGPREAEDTVGLIRMLRGRGKLPSPLYLFGYSYGATVALFAAPQLHGVRGVMALAPYDNAASVIRRAPGSGLFGFRWLVRFLSPAVMTRAIRDADTDLGLDLARISPERAVSQARACTLIVRGGKDRLIPEGPLRAMSWTSPKVRFMPVAGENHETLFIRTDRLFQPLLHWMRALAPHGADCPAAPRVGGRGSLDTRTAASAAK